MKYKFDISSKPNRLAFALGISLIVGVSCGKLTEKKTCFLYAQDAHKLIEWNCGEYKDEEVVHYEYNISNALISGLSTFGVLLILNGFVKNEG
jgi:hypothetical protein